MAKRDLNTVTADVLRHLEYTPPPKPNGAEGYTEEMGEYIVARIAQGLNLSTLCQDPDMPSFSLVCYWLSKVPEFKAMYNEARRDAVEVIAEQMFSIADDSSNDFVETMNARGETVRKFDAEAVARSKLRVETRKWYLSKIAPRVYGDRTFVETKKSHEMSESEIDAKIRQLKAQLEE